MTGITPSPENIRAEMARHQLSRPVIGKLLKFHVNSISNYVGGYRKMPPEVAHNLGYAINRLTGIRVFNVEMGRGILPLPGPGNRGAGRKPGVRLHAPRRKQRARAIA